MGHSHSHSAAPPQKKDKTKNPWRVQRVDLTCFPDVDGFSFHCGLCFQLPEEEKEQRYPPEREERWSSARDPQRPHGSAGQPYGPRTASTVVSDAWPRDRKLDWSVYMCMCVCFQLLLCPHQSVQEEVIPGKQGWGLLSLSSSSLLLFFSRILNERELGLAVIKQRTMDPWSLSAAAAAAAAVCRVDAAPPSLSPSLSLSLYLSLLHTQTHAHTPTRSHPPSLSLISHPLFKELTEAVLHSDRSRRLDWADVFGKMNSPSVLKETKNKNLNPQLIQIMLWSH